jgi:protein-S-isoprenylcysteine O-methyltransferase Ste14
MLSLSDSMARRIAEWSRKRFTEKQRLLALIPQGLLFLILIPALFYLASVSLDASLELPGFTLTPSISATLILLGLCFSGCSIWVQFRVGHGTPAPLIPTQKLLVEGPYAFCRNPMLLGTMLYYIGIGLWVGSVSFIGLVLIFTSLLIVYVKVIEEKELEERFGDEYRRYKKMVPFIIPFKGRVRVKRG